MFNMRLADMLSTGAAVDLGTVNTLIAIKGRGIVLREPTAVAVSTEDRRRILAVGREALSMLGRTPGGINVVYPMRDGVISDFSLTEAMLRAYIRKAMGGRVSAFGTKLMICVPMCISDVERRALIDAAHNAGAREVMLMDEPLAAAMGAELPVDEPIGSMIVDIGGGTTDAAVVAMGGIAAERSVRIGGTHMNEAIVGYIAREHGVAIGERTAEDVKQTLGCALIGGNERMQIRGRKADTGLPVSIAVTGSEISRALMQPMRQIADAVKQTLALTPPELSGDIMEEGIVLTGGGARIKDMDIFVARETGMEVRIDKNPMDSVVMGALKALSKGVELLGMDEDMLLEGAPLQ